METNIEKMKEISCSISTIMNVLESLQKQKTKIEKFLEGVDDKSHIMHKRGFNLIIEYSKNYTDESGERRTRIQETSAILPPDVALSALREAVSIYEKCINNKIDQWEDLRSQKIKK